MERIKSLYIDQPRWEQPIKEDDFLVTIGAKQSNSVYHVMTVNAKPRQNMYGRVIRYYVKVIDSDLPTALKRDPEQRLIPLTWYKR